MNPARAPHYALFLDLEGREVLVVGGGAVAWRKVESLLDCGARVTVVAPSVVKELDELEREQQIRIVRRSYQSEDPSSQLLAIAATDDPELNRRIAAECRERRILVNVADDPHVADFLVPSLIRRGAIQIAVSTGGGSPAIARRLRQVIEEAVEPEWDEVLGLLAELREPAKTSLPTDTARRRFFDEILDLDLLRLFREGRREEALVQVRSVCRRWGVDPGQL